MKKTIHTLLFWVLLVFFGANSLAALENTSPLPGAGPNANPQAPIFGPQFKSLEAYMNWTIPSFISANGGLGIAVGTVLNKRIGTFYFGETVKGSGQKPDGSTLFLLASITKTFTSTLAALYAEKGLLNFDDSLQKYVPSEVTVPFFNNDASHPITLETLATHTSGLPLMPVLAADGTETTPDEVFQALNQTPLGSTPGAKYIYSNFGYSLLGQVVARVANKTWENLIQDEISGPLGLIDTKVYTQLSADQIARRAPGYNAVSSEWTFFPGEGPAGGLYSTLNDMMKYLSFAMGQTGSPLNSLLPKLFQPRHSNGMGGMIGLAWNINILPGTSEQVLWKDGGLLGYQSYIGFVPSKGVGVVLLINSQGVESNSLGQQILKYLLTDPTQQLDPVQPPRDLVPLHQVPRGPGPVENLRNIKQYQR